jgi:hypothetical protein
MPWPVVDRLTAQRRRGYRKTSSLGNGCPIRHWLHNYLSQALVSAENSRSVLIMVYKGVEFTVTQVAPNIWQYQFGLGDRVITGKTKAKLSLLAIRRAQIRINRELRKASKE